MDASAVAPRPTTYMFGDYVTGMPSRKDCFVQDADEEGSPSPPSSPPRSPPTGKFPPPKGPTRPCTAGVPPRQPRKRPRSWSTAGTNNGSHGSQLPAPPATPAAHDGGPHKPNESLFHRVDRSTSNRGEDGGGGSSRPLRKSVRRAGGTAERTRPLGEGGVPLVGGDDAAIGEPGGGEGGCNGNPVADGGSFGEAAADEEASSGRSRTRRGGEGVGTREARQQLQQRRQQQQTVRVVVHEVLSEDFGLFTWPSGVLLAYLVWARRREFRGVSVVEIGAGTALPGLLAAKLGARVLLTDREGAPWVLENMRGAVAANGLAAATDDATVALTYHAGRDAGSSVGAPAGDNVHDTDVRMAGGAANAGEKGRGRRAGDGVGEEEGCSEEDGGGGFAEGSCTVRGLSWGSVGPASIKLAREQWRPQVVLGADVFYSSEHFDSVLATAFMLLSPNPSASGAGGGGGGGCDGAGVDAGTSSDAACPMPCGVGDGTAGATTGIFSSQDADTAAAASAAGSESTAAVSASFADGTATISSSYGSPFIRDRGVFLTAYHERSARRSLRPLLRKWGMEARVLHDAPRQVLPPALWDSGRYDSVALLQITLTQ